MPPAGPAVEKTFFESGKAKFGSNAQQLGGGLIPVLVKLSLDRDEEVRSGAMQALVKLDPFGRPTVLALRRQQRDRNGWMRQDAITEGWKARTSAHHFYSPLVRTLTSCPRAR